MFIPPQLPLLDYVLERSNALSQRPLVNHRCILVHHLLGSTVSLIRSLEAAGVARADLWIVGKAYSTNREALEYLEERGYQVFNPSSGYSTSVPYDSLLETTVRNILADMPADSTSPLLVLDDAGLAISKITELNPQTTDRIRGVELTTRGIRRITDVPLRFPVVNVARSWIKTTVEAPLIGTSMVNELMSVLAEYANTLVLNDRSALVVGYGAIGSQVAVLLSNQGFHVRVSEADTSQAERVRADGFEIVDLRSVIGNTSLIAGCTGRTWFKPEIASELLPGTVMANMASSDLEFGLWQFAPAHITVLPRNLYPGGIVGRDERWHGAYRLDFRDSFSYVLNSGFPLDFTGEVDPIPPTKIQLTRALVLGAALQAIQSEGAGLIDLSESFQADLAQTYASMCAKEQSGL